MALLALNLHIRGRMEIEVHRCLGRLDHWLHTGGADAEPLVEHAETLLDAIRLGIGAESTRHAKR
jgi:hypothetical protein